MSVYENSQIIKELCEKHIKEKDIIHIVRIFAPYSKYSLTSLINIYKDVNNKEILHKTINELSYSKNTLNYQDIDFSILHFVNSVTENENFILKSFEEKPTKLILFSILKLAFVSYYYDSYLIQEVKIKYDLTIEEDAKAKEIFKKNKHNGIFYRGQSNKNWRLSPSIVRKIDGNIYLDDDYYHDLLIKDGSEDKYNQLIRSNDKDAYSKYAFMQHSRCFSPFIDMSYSEEIATSFSLSNASDPCKFKNIDAAIFKIEIKDNGENVIKSESKAREFLKKQFNLKIINDRYFILGHRYKLKAHSGSDIEIYLTSIKDVFEALTPKYKVFQIYTNDRMKYQKGLFICFYDCICLKDIIVYNLIQELKIMEFIIPVKHKNKILNKINSHKRYDYNHLMNPYLFFQD